MPRVGLLVHGVQVEGGLKLGLASRQEHDSCSAGDTRERPIRMHLLDAALPFWTGCSHLFVAGLTGSLGRVRPSEHTGTW